MKAARHLIDPVGHVSYNAMAHRTMARCAGCDVEGPIDDLKQCSRCKRAYYCDERCQRAHWSVHKLACTSKNQDLAKASVKRVEDLSARAKYFLNKWTVVGALGLAFVKHRLTPPLSEAAVAVAAAAESATKSSTSDQPTPPDSRWTNGPRVGDRFLVFCPLVMRDGRDAFSIRLVQQSLFKESLVPKCQALYWQVLDWINTSPKPKAPYIFESMPWTVTQECAASSSVAAQTFDELKAQSGESMQIILTMADQIIECLASIKDPDVCFVFVQRAVGVPLIEPPMTFMRSQAERFFADGGSALNKNAVTPSPMSTPEASTPVPAADTSLAAQVSAAQVLSAMTATYAPAPEANSDMTT